MLDPFYRNVFGLDEKPIEVMEPNTTNLIIYSAVGIGMLLVVVAILINIYSCLRRRHWGKCPIWSKWVSRACILCVFGRGIWRAADFGWQIVNTAYVLGFDRTANCGDFLPGSARGLLERSDWKPESWGNFLMQNFF